MCFDYWWNAILHLHCSVRDVLQECKDIATDYDHPEYSGLIPVDCLLSQEQLAHGCGHTNGLTQGFPGGSAHKD